MTRPDWDTYFMDIVHTVAERATCDRGRTACVITKDHRILTTGYVGASSGMPHCDEVGHLMNATIHEDGHRSDHCVRCVHAEQSAICQAAKFGIPLDGGTVYCKLSPCRTCAMLLVTCGIKRIVAEYKYKTYKESEEIFKAANVEISYIHDEELHYE